LKRLTETARSKQKENDINNFIITVIEDTQTPVEYKTESLRAAMILKAMMDKSGTTCFVYDREGKRIPTSVIEKSFYYTEFLKRR
jgi:hypothetical protein